jgi:hypothetical protein
VVLHKLAGEVASSATCSQPITGIQSYTSHLWMERPLKRYNIVQAWGEEGMHDTPSYHVSYMMNVNTLQPLAFRCSKPFDKRQLKRQNCICVLTAITDNWFIEHLLYKPYNFVCALIMHLFQKFTRCLDFWIITKTVLNLYFFNFSDLYVETKTLLTTAIFLTQKV